MMVGLKKVYQQFIINTDFHLQESTSVLILEYSIRYCKKEVCLILAYIIVVNLYHIIYDASTVNNLKFYGKGNYKNYGCHYAPVMCYGSENSTDYHPPPVSIVLNELVF